VRGSRGKETDGERERETGRWSKTGKRGRRESEIKCHGERERYRVRERERQGE